MLARDAALRITNESVNESEFCAVFIRGRSVGKLQFKPFGDHSAIDLNAPK